MALGGGPWIGTTAGNNSSRDLKYLQREQELTRLKSSMFLKQRQVKSPSQIVWHLEGEFWIRLHLAYEDLPLTTYSIVNWLEL